MELVNVGQTPGSVARVLPSVYCGAVFVKYLSILFFSFFFFLLLFCLFACWIVFGDSVSLTL